MRERIKYKPMKNKENVVESIKSFVSERTGAVYKVRLDLNNMIYGIKNLNSEQIFYGGENINNYIVLARTARKHLERLGVKLGKESRMRTFGRCEKGYSQKKHVETLKEDNQ